MLKQKLERILKEEWLESNCWHSLEKSNQKKFHKALQRVYKELDKTPTNDDFICVVNSVICDSSKSEEVIEFAKRAEIMFNYYKMVN